MIQITVDDRDVQAALTRLSLRAQNLQPILQSLGEDLMERSKQRFASGTGPDGARWAANARSTIEAFVRQKGGFGRNGINRKGQALATGKKPLFGASNSLRHQFSVNAGPAHVIVANSMRYAAIQQFGGMSGRGHQTQIPARPFFPIKADGSLYPDEKKFILDAILNELSNTRG